jgi:hypothetical protein
LKGLISDVGKVRLHAGLAVHLRKLDPDNFRLALDLAQVQPD